MGDGWPVAPMTGPCACGRRAVGLVRTLEGHQDWVRSVAWSGDGQWLASGAVMGPYACGGEQWTPGARSKGIRVRSGAWRGQGWAMAGQWRVPDRARVAVAAWWHARRASGLGRSVAWSRDGQWLASGGRPDRAPVGGEQWPPGAHARRASGSVWSVAWSGDGQWLASGP